MNITRRLRFTFPGQSIVEFALILPIFMMLIMGVVDLGRGVFYNNMLSDAAREGARVGIIATRTSAEMCAAAISQVLAPGLTGQACAASGNPAVTNDGQLTVSVHRGTAGDVTDLDSVTLTYSFLAITPLISTVPISLSATSSMYVEGGVALPTTTPVPTNTPTPTVPPLPTSTPTVTPTMTITPTVTSTSTSTFTTTPTTTNTQTTTPTRTFTPTVTNTSTITPTNTRTNTPTVTNTPTITPTFTRTNTPTNTPTVTPTCTPKPHGGGPPC